jgi:hypothetical protein
VSDTHDDLARNEAIADAELAIREAAVALARLTVAAENTPMERADVTARRIVIAWQILAADRDPLNSPLT